MDHPNYSILHHLMYQPIKYAHVLFLVSSSSQLIEVGFKQRKEEALSWPWSYCNKLSCCYTVSQTQDLCVEDPSSSALERILHFPACVHWTPEGPAVEQKGREYPMRLHQPAFPSVRQGGTGWPNRILQWARACFYTDEPCRFTRVRVLRLWASQDRRSILCSKFSRSVTTQ